MKRDSSKKSPTIDRKVAEQSLLDAISALSQDPLVPEIDKRPILEVGRVLVAKLHPREASETMLEKND